MSELLDRLDVLREGDHFRDWRTLDDKRVCVLCGRIFSGREVQISQDGGGSKLNCPTRNCPSGVHQWIYAGIPLISDDAHQDWWRALGSPPDADSTPSSNGLQKI